MAKREGSGPDGGAAHETRDVDVRAIGLSALVLAALVALSMAAMMWTFRIFARREAAGQLPPTTLVARPSAPLPPEPRLQDNPLRELRQLKAEEEALMTGYGWVDRDRGVARIPIETAMELTVRRGLPARPSPAAPRAGQEAAP